MLPDSVTRFSISMPESLVRRLDGMVKQNGFANRSRAVCKLVRDSLQERTAKSGNRQIAGTITLVYNHHKPYLQALLTSIQHEHHPWIVSAMHVHLDHDNCLEVLVVRGRAGQIRTMADKLIAAKGVKHGKLTVTGARKDLQG
jgi:CopG family transcriptional regulator, nickel-responsive regulator